MVAAKDEGIGLQRPARNPTRCKTTDPALLDDHRRRKKHCD
jgi:hypothetical protein